jgi:A1 cistron-splicing factor AAR2
LEDEYLTAQTNHVTSHVISTLPSIMETTAAVLLLDLPSSALAGIDLLSFTTTPRFRGVKDLPSGWHFVFTGSSTAFSVRHGLWFRVQDRHQLTITRWHPRDETLSTVTDEAEKLRWRANIGEVWERGLTPYRQSSTTKDEVQDLSGDWLQLTSYVSEALLCRITQGESESLHLTSASSAAQDLDDIPGLASSESKTHPEKELHFLPVDLKRTWRPDATGRERTDAAQDRSWALSSLMSAAGNHHGDEIIGELQFCFLMVLVRD